MLTQINSCVRVAYSSATKQNFNSCMQAAQAAYLSNIPPKLHATLKQGGESLCFHLKNAGTSMKNLIEKAQIQAGSFVQDNELSNLFQKLFSNALMKQESNELDTVLILSVFENKKGFLLLKHNEISGFFDRWSRLIKSPDKDISYDFTVSKEILENMSQPLIRHLLSRKDLPIFFKDQKDMPILFQRCSETHLTISKEMIDNMDTHLRKALINHKEFAKIVQAKVNKEWVIEQELQALSSLDQDTIGGFFDDWSQRIKSPDKNNPYDFTISKKVLSNMDQSLIHHLLSRKDLPIFFKDQKDMLALFQRCSEAHLAISKEMIGNMCKLLKRVLINYEKCTKIIPNLDNQLFLAEQIPANNQTIYTGKEFINMDKAQLISLVEQKDPFSFLNNRGTAVALFDQCYHRGIQLSIGNIACMDNRLLGVLVLNKRFHNIVQKEYDRQWALETRSIDDQDVMLMSREERERFQVIQEKNPQLENAHPHHGIVKDDNSAALIMQSPLGQEMKDIIVSKKSLPNLPKNTLSVLIKNDNLTVKSIDDEGMQILLTRCMHYQLPLSRKIMQVISRSETKLKYLYNLHLNEGNRAQCLLGNNPLLFESFIVGCHSYRLNIQALKNGSPES